MGPSTVAESLASFFSYAAADFIVVKSTQKLADKSEIVVQGTIVDVLDGPIVGPPDDDFTDIGLVVLHIGDARILKGKLPPESDGNVYLSIIAPMGAKIVAEELGADAQIVLYGNQIRNVESTSTLTNAEAGRPVGQPLFATSHPQGLVIDVLMDGTGDLVWPQTQYTARGDITEALPGGPLIGMDLTLNQ